MDVPTLSLFLRPILTVTSVWNTGETGDMNWSQTAKTAMGPSGLSISKNNKKITRKKRESNSQAHASAIKGSFINYVTPFWPEIDPLPPS